MNPLDNIPLWLLAVDVILLPSVFFLGGFLQGKRVAKTESSDGPLGSMVASVLGLLAFMLAFTFGLAAGRFDERRLLVVDEANAIGTAYLRADLLDEPTDRNALRKLLREYVQIRIQPLNDLDAAVARSNAIQNSMWKLVSTNANRHPTPIAGLVVSAMNDVIDIQEKRVAAGVYGRVPSPVWLCLLIVSALAMSSMGYYCGKTGTRAWAVAVILLACYGAVLFLAADLDRPQAGSLKTNLTPLLDVARQMGD